MAVFDPKKHQDDSDGGDWLTVAGEFLLVIKSLKRDVNPNSKKQFLLAKQQVIYGPAKGKIFFERYYLNQPSWWKIGKLCKAMGWEEAWDLDNINATRKALLNRPFKASTAVRTDGKKKYAEIKQFMDPTPEELAAMNTWVTELQQNADPDAEFPPDPDFDNRGDDFGSDDIPF